MTQKLDNLQAALQAALGDKIQILVRARGEITVTVAADAYLDVAKALRDDPTLKFEQLMDLCGLGFSEYRNEAWDGRRLHLDCHAWVNGELLGKPNGGKDMKFSFPRLIEHAAEHSPLRRPIGADDVSNSVLYLCSPLASAVTGQILYVDCGYHAMVI
jgi:NADH:ubiquinone oxidoreductase subunit C